MSRVEERAGVWADLIGSSPNHLGYPSWEEGCRRGMKLSDGAACIAPGMLGFAQGCGSRAVRGVRLNHDEKYQNAPSHPSGRGERKRSAQHLYWAKPETWEYSRTHLIDGL